MPFHMLRGSLEVKCPWIFRAYVALALTMPAVSSFLATFSADASPALNAASLAFSRALTSAFSQGFWFGKQVTVLVIATSSAHLEIKPRTEEVYSSRSTSPSHIAASLKTCQSVHWKQSWSTKAASLGHTVTVFFVGLIRLNRGR